MTTIANTAFEDKWLHRRVILPSKRRGIVTGCTYDRLTVHYTDFEGGTVTIHPTLVETTDGPRPPE